MTLFYVTSFNHLLTQCRGKQGADSQLTFCVVGICRKNKFRRYILVFLRQVFVSLAAILEIIVMNWRKKCDLCMN